MLCWCFLPLIFFFQSYMVTPSDKSPCVWRRSRHFLHLSSYPPLSLWLLVISISEMLMGGTLELNWIHGHFSHWLGRKTSIKTAALSGSGYSPGGGRWGFRSLFLNLEKGTSEKWALQDRRKRSEKVMQGLGAPLSPQRLWVALWHLLLWLQRRLWSFRGFTSLWRLSLLARHVEAPGSEHVQVPQKCKRKRLNTSC